MHGNQRTPAQVAAGQRSISKDVELEKETLNSLLIDRLAVWPHLNIRVKEIFISSYSFVKQPSNAVFLLSCGSTHSTI
jgi:hypothetical protein